MRIDVQRVDRVVTQTARYRHRSAPEVMEAAGAALEQVQTAADRSDPQVAERVFGNGARLWRRCRPVPILTAEGIARRIRRSRGS